MTTGNNHTGLPLSCDVCVGIWGTGEKVRKHFSRKDDYHHHHRRHHFLATSEVKLIQIQQQETSKTGGEAGGRPPRLSICLLLTCG